MAFAAAVPLIAAGLNFAGGLMGNSSSSSEARKQRNWQWRMTRDQYKLQTEGLKFAGLNPMLAAGTTPHTPTTTPAHQENPMRGAGEIVANSLINKATVQNLESNSAKNVADANKSNADAALASAQKSEVEARIPTYASNIDVNTATASKLRFELPKILEETQLTRSQTEKVYNEITQINKQGVLTQAQTKEALARAGLTTAQIAEIQPRINEMIARTHNLNEETRVKNLIGNFADTANIPKIMGSSAGSGFAKEVPDWFQQLYDLFNPGSGSAKSKFLDYEDKLRKQHKQRKGK